MPQSETLRTRYVLGFLFSPGHEHLVLLEKNRGPGKMAGQLNGIGGHVEEGETSQAPGAAYLARACVEANRAGRKEEEVIAEGETHRALRPLLEAVYGPKEWLWPTVDVAKLAKLAAERLQQPLLSETGTDGR